jgi:hypothetical protein
MLKHILTSEAVLLLLISGAVAQMQRGAMEAARAGRPKAAAWFARETNAIPPKGSGS